LIELLVVIAIIALLLTILMPALDRATELARRTVCASNLRGVATVAHAFGADYDGHLAVGGRGPNHGRDIRPQVMMAEWPREVAGQFVDEFDTIRYHWSGTPRAPAWQGHGTSWETWRKYGASQEILDCPSSPFVTGEPSLSDWTALGMRLQHDYLVISGARNAPAEVPGGMWPGGIHWVEYGLAEPAVMQNDPQLADRIVAADRVEWDGSAGLPWSNHEGGPFIEPRPSFQNVAFGDGSVRPYGEAEYKSDLFPDNASWQGPSHPPDHMWGKVFWGTPE
jgi:hypothetical protein